MNRLDRRSLLGLLAAAPLAGVVGCAATAETADSAQQSSAAVPTPVTHRYGTTTVPAAAKRVVCLGQTDHDAAVALGTVPVAVAGFLDSTYSPFRPWNASHFGTEPPVLDMLEINFEKVAALAPDLIIAVQSGVTKKDYAKLTALAPTVAQPNDYEDWAIPTRPHTLQVGAALGRRAEAGTLVDELEQKFADAKASDTSLRGASAICVEWFGSDFLVLGASAPRSQFLVDLGLTLSPELTALVGKGYNAALSAERLDLLADLDLLVWTTDADTEDDLLDQRLVQNLASTKEGRYVLAANGGNDDLLYSMDWGSVLSSSWALENATPRLVRAADGDPATDPNT